MEIISCSTRNRPTLRHRCHSNKAGNAEAGLPLAMSKSREENAIKMTGSIKGGKFIDYLSDNYLPNKKPNAKSCHIQTEPKF